ncbi:MAG: diphosphomevalonate decarboxylase [Myxococcota bacterium]
MDTATAVARSNIALVKYWGKLTCPGNLGATGSISMTLAGFSSTTTVGFSKSIAADEISLDGRAASGRERDRMTGFLDRVREAAGITDRATVVSTNNFPTAGGLASSASGFAALAAAATRAAGLGPDLAELARLARLGSGSAPRSLLGGFVELERGDAGAPGICRVSQLAGENDWGLCMVVAIAGGGAKKVGSTDGMERSRLTSAYYERWIGTHQADMDAARTAIKGRDFTVLGKIAEASCMKMHAVMMTSSPPLLYWRPATVAAMHAVWELRSSGVEGYVTIDAGPHVKVLCLSGDAPQIAATLAGIPGVARTVIEKPGPGVEWL